MSPSGEELPLLKLLHGSGLVKVKDRRVLSRDGMNEDADTETQEVQSEHF